MIIINTEHTSKTHAYKQNRNYIGKPQTHKNKKIQHPTKTNKHCIETLTQNKQNMISHTSTAYNNTSTHTYKRPTPSKQTNKNIN